MSPNDARSAGEPSGELSAVPDTGPRHAWRVDLLARVLLGAAAGEEGLLLDAGCGDGSLALALAREGRTVLAFDPDPARLARLRNRAARAEKATGPRATGPGATGPGRAGTVLFFRADATAIPLSDASVAGAAAGEVVEHIARDDLALREIARVLAPGGALALTVPAGLERMGAVDRAAGHVRRYDRAMLVMLIEGAGLRVELLRGWGFPFGRVYDRWVQRPALALRGRRGGRRVAGAADGIGRLGRAGWMIALWRGLFAVDEWVAEGHAAWVGERGSGWVAVGRVGAEAEPSFRWARAPRTGGSVDPLNTRPGLEGRGAVR